MPSNLAFNDCSDEYGKLLKRVQTCFQGIRHPLILDDLQPNFGPCALIEEQLPSFGCMADAEGELSNM
jgi:hypothetical protein